ncbi:hypothetical protein OKA05_15170 [Luteolibacter arcticus]|uniref:Uncharacterized protein n=1 Tax=Luteolibacter arcticus TaxID=1581411 RepID=A0ABT3GK82_9BACT|nr:hypothetical protein [Luteolibacter arcticus]MCW1923908.1 hypothetical protein [Luteolibacter arcticus]
MTLLTVIAVGLLGLSSISLRQSASGSAMAEARANARLALMLAIGDLQKCAGSDKAVTATSELHSEEPKKANLTGVWSSWDVLGEIKDFSNASPDYAGEKSKRFQRWLVSDADPQAATNPTYGETDYQDQTIELVGEGSLGQAGPDAPKIKAGRVLVAHNGKPAGAYAWHVSDEAVKARIGTYRDPDLNSSMAEKRALLSGNRPEVSVIGDADGKMLDFLPKDDTANSFGEAKTAAGKLVDFNQTELFAKDTGIPKKFRNDITPYSLGLLTDVRNGGIKKDLTSMFEASALPPAYAGKKLFESTSGITAPSDPNWSALASYHKTYKDLIKPDTAPTFRVAPKEKININDAKFALKAPVGFAPVPVIAKVEFLVSLVLRDEHLLTRKPSMPYLMHLLNTPLVTLHNPYNVVLEFDQMQVVMRNLPLGIKFYVNNVPMSAEMARIGDLRITPSNRGEKSFAMDISNWTSPDASGTRKPITMQPGQTLVCGPYVDPGLKFMPNSTNPLFDNGNNASGVSGTGAVNPVKAKPGFAGKGVGYDCDYMVPGYSTVPTNPNTQSTTPGSLVIKLAEPADTIHCEFGLMQPAAPAAPNDRLKVYATIQGTQYGGIVVVYNDQLTLDKRFGAVKRFPQKGAMSATEFYEPNTKPLAHQAKVKTIGMLSAYARTSNGGVYETGSRTPGSGVNSLLDGRLAGKPFLFDNFASPVEQLELKNDVAGNFSRELNFQPLPGEIDDVFEINGTRTPALTGNTSMKGIKSGASFELPSGPLQSIADFRRSNALTTPFQPAFVQPVANSSVSPMMATTSVKANGVSYPLLDHSILANDALYDEFYFSTLAPAAGVGAAQVFRDFMAGARALPNQSFQHWLPEGETAESMASKCYSGSTPSADAYQQLALCQMVKGPFNVNSTSVQAWKAMLSAMSGSEVNVLWAASGQLKDEKPADVPIMAMSLPVAGSTSKPFSAADIDNERTRDFNGYRELSAAEVEKLAGCIVDQVRARGPFLSLSEFVNRRIGADSEMTRAGALQVAIKKSGINHDGTFLNQVLLKSEDFDAKDISGAPLFNYKTRPLTGDNPAEGAPGWISQGDLMHLLEPSATVRSDTFVIRSCGEATDGDGDVIARAYAEAVVQRVPEYVDPADSAATNIYQSDVSSSTVNLKFGRRLKVMSFRWLSPSEI